MRAFVCSKVQTRALASISFVPKRPLGSFSGVWAVEFLWLYDSSVAQSVADFVVLTRQTSHAHHSSPHAFCLSVCLFCSDVFLSL